MGSEVGLFQGMTATAGPKDFPQELDFLWNRPFMEVFQLTPKTKAARLIIHKENPLTLEHLSRTAWSVATIETKQKPCQFLEGVKIIFQPDFSLLLRARSSKPRPKSKFHTPSKKAKSPSDSRPGEKRSSPPADARKSLPTSRSRTAACSPPRTIASSGSRSGVVLDSRSAPLISHRHFLSNPREDGGSMRRGAKSDWCRTRTAN